VATAKVEHCMFQGDFTQTHQQRLAIRSAAVEPLPEGSAAFMHVESKRVVLLEE
jgi:hypothetical protein